MNWLAFALIGTATLATTAILEKFILSLFMPGILKEEITRETLVFKLSAVILVAAGMYLIT